MKVLIFLIVLISSMMAKAQNVSDSIILEDGFRGFVYLYKGESVNTKKVFILMESNDLAYDEFSSARDAYVFGNVFAMMGCVLIIYPFVNSAIGNDPNYGPAFAGVCFIGISIPIFRSYNRKTISSIVKYNEGLTLPPSIDNTSGFYLKNTQNGIGIVYNF